VWRNGQPAGISCVRRGRSAAYDNDLRGGRAVLESFSSSMYSFATSNSSGGVVSFHSSAILNGGFGSSILLRAFFRAESG